MLALEIQNLIFWHFYEGFWHLFGNVLGHVWQIFRGMWEVWGAGVYNEKAYKTYMILHMNLHINSNPY